MKDLVFVSVAFGQRYLDQQTRLKQSILDIYPEANIMFWYDELPPGSKSMNDSLYGFKVHAIYEAQKKFSKVLWLDPAMILVKEVDILDGFNFAVVKDDNLVHKFTSNKSLEYFGLSRDHITEKRIHLVGGSLYYFDFNSEDVKLLFSTWYNAEANGIFGSQQQEASQQLQGHRSDETCMALSMYKTGFHPLGAYEIGYCIESNPTFIKKHFK